MVVRAATVVLFPQRGGALRNLVANGNPALLRHHCQRELAAAASNTSCAVGWLGWLGRRRRKHRVQCSLPDDASNAVDAFGNHGCAQSCDGSSALSCSEQNAVHRILFWEQFERERIC